MVIAINIYDPDRAPCAVGHDVHGASDVGHASAIRRDLRVVGVFHLKDVFCAEGRQISSEGRVSLQGKCA
jgi:hypothetical protein